MARLSTNWQQRSPAARSRVATQIAAALGVTPTKPTAELQLGDPQLLTFDMGDAARYFSVPRDTIAQRTRKIANDQQAELSYA